LVILYRRRQLARADRITLKDDVVFRAKVIEKLSSGFSETKIFPSRLVQGSSVHFPTQAGDTLRSFPGEMIA